MVENMSTLPKWSCSQLGNMSTRLPRAGCLSSSDFPERSSDYKLDIFC